MTSAKMVFVVLLGTGILACILLLVHTSRLIKEFSRVPFYQALGTLAFFAATFVRAVLPRSELSNVIAVVLFVVAAVSFLVMFMAMRQVCRLRTVKRASASE